MKILIEFQEKAVIDAASKYVMNNLKRIGDPDFMADVVKIAVDEVKKTLTIKVGSNDFNVFKGDK